MKAHLLADLFIWVEPVTNYFGSVLFSGMDRIGPFRKALLPASCYSAISSRKSAQEEQLLPA